METLTAKAPYTDPVALSYASLPCEDSEIAAQCLLSFFCKCIWHCFLTNKHSVHLSV